MQKAKPNRKPRFLKALALAGLSQAAWAREQDISPAHLSLVLNGKRESNTLEKKIDTFASEQLYKDTALAS